MPAFLTYVILMNYYPWYVALTAGTLVDILFRIWFWRMDWFMEADKAEAEVIYEARMENYRRMSA